MSDLLDCLCLVCEPGCDQLVPAGNIECDDCEMGDHRPQRDDSPGDLPGPDRSVDEPYPANPWVKP